MIKDILKVEDSSIIECPQCSNEKIWKDGFRYTDHGKIQRFMCRECGYRFSYVKNSNTPRYRNNCQIGDNQKESKNLTVATENQATGEISKKHTLFNYSWYLKKEGLENPTIKSYTKLLRILAKRGANLLDPESVKGKIAVQKWVNKRKQNAVAAYTHYLEMTGGKWNPPFYKEVEKPIFIPRETEIDALISGTGLKTSVLLQTLKETAARIGEIQALNWIDVDFDLNIIRITPEKGSRPRTIKVSESLMNRLGHVKKVNNTEDPTRIFGKNYNSVYRNFSYQRNRIAKKLGNERLTRISFHTLRHWHATKLYHETKDIMFVQRRLGHRSIMNTMKYIHLAETYFGQEPEEYIVKVAETVEEALPLIEAGFVEASDFNGVKIYKIPKTRVRRVSL
jgi:integrase